MRVTEHPILEPLENQKKVKFMLDGKEVEGYENEPIAAALRDIGVLTHRYTAREHKPRGIFCAIGRCTDCVMIVNGKPNVRTCVTALREGMIVETQDGISKKEN